jgi:hypothetical protein
MRTRGTAGLLSNPILRALARTGADLDRVVL